MCGEEKARIRIIKSTQNRPLRLVLCASLVMGCCIASKAHSDEWGYLIHVALPIDDISERQSISAIRSVIASNQSEGSRPTVVLQFGESRSSDTGSETKFERALGLCRFLTSDAVKSIRTIAFLSGSVEGHAVLPVLSCDQIATTSAAQLGAAGIIESDIEPFIESCYRSISQRRRTIPVGVATAMLDRDVELARVTPIDGGEQFLSGDELQVARDTGAVAGEQILAPTGQYATFTGTELRKNRWATHEVRDADELAAALGLPGLRDTESAKDDEPKAVLGELNGPVNPRRMGRLTNSLSDAVNRRGYNQLLINVNSSGGNLTESVRVASMIANMPRDGIRTASYIEQGRSDAAIVALAAQRVYMSPKATLGGPGEANFNADTLLDLRETIGDIAKSSRRSPALLTGLMDYQLEVFRYSDKRTGRVEYFSVDDLAGRDDVERWTQQEQVSLSSGLSAEDALRLGLIDGISGDLRSASEQIGLERVPSGVEERKIIQFVEKLGRQAWLARLLLFVGFFMLMVETGAPGLGVPGFLALVCLLLFFWTQAVGGTAEWLEILLFAGGVACLIIEAFVIPGLGIFGIGGAIMVISSLVLVSQTFVVPTNSYQYAEMTDSLLRVISAFIGIAGGVVALRWMVPQLPFLRNLVMHQDAEEIRARDQSEALVNWNHLIGRIGMSTTPLVPAGKARFDDDLVAVISAGPLIEPGKAVIVKEVHGNRIVVEERLNPGASH